eukprot:TRINITY_DN706_c0_g1_i1.p1 TRINITY_DN706_c0_g1~~TRINITY_DN706_c0_g1_i1.p1  ORF type:complete len:581 (-),score=284.99 TRINITY_DN706_c0_g1_i1:232-1974(-)
MFASLAIKTIKHSSRRLIQPNLLNFKRTMSSYIPNCTSGGISRIPTVLNEPLKTYLKGSKERIDTENEIKRMREKEIEIPLIIDGKEVFTGETMEVRIPHEHNKIIARCHIAKEEHVQQAILSGLEAQKKWSSLTIEDRLSIFLKAAELIAGPYRSTLIAATVLGQSKNFYQAEIDAAAELIDFLRFNVKFAQQIYEDQPQSPFGSGVWNRVEYRPLEGFIYAISPFNFTAIGGNLPTAPAMLGNVALWKPSDYAVYSNYIFQRILMEAGLPAGVINFVPGNAQMITNIALTNRNLAGVHFTGSTQVFRQIWKSIGLNIENYRSYPRIVGETGGKDFIFAHQSANVDELATALVRGAFEYAGQKCSACSRAYIPQSLWESVSIKIKNQLKEAKIGNPENVSTFVNAVIHEHSFNKLKQTIDFANQCSDAQIIFGGSYDNSIGWFIDPTVILVTDPNHRLMSEEFFGPILTIYVYPDSEYQTTLELCNQTSQYSLTGSIFATDRYAIAQASKVLENAAGNFYINDKCTGAVVAQQSFGGSRGSGTNDKAGSYLNLLRWVSPRSIKETFVAARNFPYPYMQD